MPSGRAAVTAAARPGDAPGTGRFDERFLRRLESLVLTIRRSARMSAGLLRANRASKRSVPGWSSPITATTRRATICATWTGTSTAVWGGWRCGCSRRKKICWSRCWSTPARR
jgi:hypothetical protein